MKEKINIPGPAKSIYGLYMGFLLLVTYTGFNTFHEFASGWRYPWTNAFLRLFNLYAGWALALVALVYLYYATLGRPKDWNEPLGWFRIVLAVLAIGFWFLVNAIATPFGWMHWLVSLFGGAARTYAIYELYLWLLILVNVIYVYARWAKSERFPRLTAPKAEQEGGLK